jgi:plastocyanin
MKAHWSWLLAPLLLGACGGDGDEMKEPSPPSQDGAAGAEPGAGAMPEVFNGCGPEDFEDRGAAGDERVVKIAAEGLSFTPRCLELAAGQTVSFEGRLSAHPLAPGSPNDPDAGSPNNPIAITSSGASVTFTFEERGTYPYFCQLHAFGDGQGMAGAVRVR